MLEPRFNKGTAGSVQAASPRGLYRIPPTTASRVGRAPARNRHTQTTTGNGRWRRAVATSWVRSRMCLVPLALLGACGDEPNSLLSPAEEPAVTAVFETIDPIESARPSIWISPDELEGLATEGPAWEALRSESSKNCGPADISDAKSKANICVLAKALVAIRTDDSDLRSEVVASLAEIASTTSYSGTSLALGRQVAAYVMAADIIDLASLEPELDGRFRVTLRALLHFGATGGGVSSLTECHEVRPNRSGSHCGASRAAIAAYLGDAELLERVALVFKGWLGDREAYSGFEFGSDRSWHCDPSNPVGINPSGCARDGHVLDGVLADDQRSGGSYAWPPEKTGSSYEGMQGALVQAIILHRQGYDVFSWEDQALLRAFDWLHAEAGTPAVGDDEWQPHVLNHFYGTDFPAAIPARSGKNVGWVDWTLSDGVASVAGNGPRIPKKGPPSASPPPSDPPASDPPASDPPSNDPPSSDPPPSDPPANEAPSAGWAASCDELRCEFDGRSSTDDNGIATFEWEFGDGTRATGSRPSHTYGADGTYRVRLTVTDNGGLTDSRSADVTVDAASPPPPPPPPPPPSSNPGGIWISAAEIAQLPTSGSAWNALVSAANNIPRAEGGHNSNHDVHTLAAALVAARTQDNAYRTKAITNLKAAIGTESDGNSLSLARNLVSYVIAADVIGYRDPAFVAWVDRMRTYQHPAGGGCSGWTCSVIGKHEDRASNHGSMAGASRMAAALYVGDQQDFARAVKVLRGYMGDRSAYASFNYGDDLSWQPNRNSPVGIAPKGSTINGHNVDGVMPDDQRRCGSFSWPACTTHYTWEGLQGLIVQAWIVHRQGLDVFEWSDRALLRAVQWLYGPGGNHASGDDRYQLPLIDAAYNTNYWDGQPAGHGKNMGWTAWTHR